MMQPEAKKAAPDGNHLLKSWNSYRMVFIKHLKSNNYIPSVVINYVLYQLNKNKKFYDDIFNLR